MRINDAINRVTAPARRINDRLARITGWPFRLNQLELGSPIADRHGVVIGTMRRIGVLGISDGKGNRLAISFAGSSPGEVS